MIHVGTAITRALFHTTKPIVLRDIAMERVAVIPKDDVPMYLARGYEVHGRGKRRVDYLCPPQPARPVRPDPRWEACLRTCASAVLPPSMDLMLELYPHQL